MDQDQRISFASRSHVGADHRLAGAGWRDKYADLVRQQSIGRALLRRGQLSVEPKHALLAVRPPIGQFDPAAETLNQRTDGVETASRSMTSSTLMRVPLMTGFPTSTFGSATIRLRQSMRPSLAPCCHYARVHQHKPRAARPVIERRGARMPHDNGTRCSSESENLQILNEFDRWADVGRENRALDRFGKKY